VAHGCQAGLQQQACDEVYITRIHRHDEHYSSRKLYAFGSNLGAVACFFEQPWSQVSSALTEDAKAWFLNEAAVSLRALGRLTEALVPMRSNLKMRVERKEWQHAPSSAGNLSELELALGEVAGAVRDANQSVTYADLSGYALQRMSKRATYGSALQSAGHRDEAETLFRKAEQMQKEAEPNISLLYSLRGFHYCDLFLAAAEHAAWQQLLNPQSAIRNPQYVESCRAVTKRAA